jgi:hypothetical protein
VRDRDRFLDMADFERNVIDAHDAGGGAWVCETCSVECAVGRARYVEREAEGVQRDRGAIFLGGHRNRK